MCPDYPQEDAWQKGIPPGGRHSDLGVLGYNSPCRDWDAPGLPGKWICSLPPWHTSWASREAQTCRECLNGGNRSHSVSGLGLEFPGDPRELTQLCGPVMPSPLSEVFSSCTGNNESETQKCQQSLRIPHIALIAGTRATPSLLLLAPSRCLPEEKESDASRGF